MSSSHQRKTQFYRKRYEQDTDSSKTKKFDLNEYLEQQSKKEISMGFILRDDLKSPRKPKFFSGYASQTNNKIAQRSALSVRKKYSQSLAGSLPNLSPKESPNYNETLEKLMERNRVLRGMISRKTNEELRLHKNIEQLKERINHQERIIMKRTDTLRDRESRIDHYIAKIKRLQVQIEVFKLGNCKHHLSMKKSVQTQTMQTHVINVPQD